MRTEGARGGPGRMVPARAAARMAAVALSALAVAGCAARWSGAGPAPARLTPAQRQEIIRSHGLDPRSFVDPLAVTEAMRVFARRHARGGSPQERLRRLNRALFDREEFGFTYEERETATAAEAFAARKGNCVAITNLFIAMGRAVGVPVRAGLLRRTGRTEREGDLVVINSHLVAVYPHARGLTVYDFYRDRQGPTGPLRVLGDLWVEAITLNNRGVEALREEDLETARKLFELAARFAPDFAAAQGNLGVVRRRAGDIPGAFAAYRTALRIEPGDAAVLGNLAALYTSLGRRSEARAAILAADLSTASPFLLVSRGDLALGEGDVDEAVRFYRRAHRLQPRLPDPLIALAKAEISRGRTRAARRALDRALEVDPGNDDAIALREGLEPGPG